MSQVHFEDLPTIENLELTLETGLHFLTGKPQDEQLTGFIDGESSALFQFEVRQLLPRHASGDATKEWHRPFGRGTDNVQSHYGNGHAKGMAFVANWINQHGDTAEYIRSTDR